MNDLIELILEKINIVKSSDYFLKDNLRLFILLFIDFENVLSLFRFVMNLRFLKVIRSETIMEKVDVLADLLFENRVKLIFDKMVKLLSELCFILLRKNFDSLEQELKRFVQ